MQRRWGDDRDARRKCKAKVRGGADAGARERRFGCRAVPREPLPPLRSGRAISASGAEKVLRIDTVELLDRLIEGGIGLHAAARWHPISPECRGWWIVCRSCLRLTRDVQAGQSAWFPRELASDQIKLPRFRPHQAVFASFHQVDKSFSRVDKSFHEVDKGSGCPDRISRWPGHLIRAGGYDIQGHGSRIQVACISYPGGWIRYPRAWIRAKTGPSAGAGD
jgi:hypothetical protein